MITESDARTWIEAYGQAWVTRDPDRIVRLFTPDATYRERRFQPALKGIDAIRNYWEVIVVASQRDVSFEPDFVAVAGDQAVIHWTAQFTWLPINGIMELDAMNRITFAGETLDGLRLATAFEEWIDIREG